MAFSPDGTTLAAVVEEGEVRLWRVADGTLLHTLRGHEAPISLLRFTPDGAYVVSGSASSSRLLLHDTKSGAVVLDTTAHLEPVVAYAAASRAPRIAVGRHSGELELFDLATASKRLVRVAEGAVVGVDLSADGALAAACCDDGVVRLVDARTGAILHELQHPALPFSVALGDGVVITQANDLVVHRLRLGGGRARRTCVSTWRAHAPPMRKPLRDPKRFGGRGVLRLYLTDDARCQAGHRRHVDGA